MGAGRLGAAPLLQTSLNNVVGPMGCELAARCLFRSKNCLGEDLRLLLIRLSTPPTLEEIQARLETINSISKALLFPDCGSVRAARKTPASNP